MICEAPESIPPGSRLRLEGIRKAFGATQALRRVDLEIGHGEIHALIGENGAGKSTLMKIISGAHQADEGSMSLDGTPYLPRNPMQARLHGVAMIYQELNLAPDLSVAENILLGRLPSKMGWVNRRAMRDVALQALESLHPGGLDPNARVGSLNIAEQQIVEIARALVDRPRVLIMDEPTSSLTQLDSERLFATIRRLKEQGVSVVYISHFLEECQALCDRFTVLRDGATTLTGDMKSTTLHDIIEAMVGRELDELYPKGSFNPGPVALELQGVSGVAKPKGATLQVRQGEILGIAGLIGAGRTEMVRAVFGLDSLSEGSIAVNQSPHPAPTPSKMIRSGMGFLSEDRKQEGLMLNRDLADNLTLSHLRPFCRFGWIHNRHQARQTLGWMEKLAVKADSPSQRIQELSGGNQQKIAFARLLHQDAAILLLDEPTRGIDVASKTRIYAEIRRLAAEGRTILFISSYLPELLGMCDTIAVMCRGRLTEARPASEWTEHQLMRAAITGEMDSKSLSPEA